MARNPFLEIFDNPAPDIPGTFWATVTSISPLRVKRDAEPVLPVTPQTLEKLSVGDRVLCLWERRQVIVLGRMGGPPEPELAYPAPNTVRIGGQNYALSGLSSNVPSYSWSSSDPPIYRTTISMPVPYTPPSGYSFNWSVALASSTFTMAGNADYTITSSGTQRIRVLQVGISTTDALTSLGWQLVKI